MIAVFILVIVIVVVVVDVVVVVWAHPIVDQPGLKFQVGCRSELYNLS